MNGVALEGPVAEPETEVDGEDGTFNEEGVRKNSKRTSSLITPPEEPEDNAFREFLEKAGLIRTLSKCIISLYEAVERPENPIQVFLAQLAEGVPMAVELLDNTHVGDFVTELADLEIEKQSLLERLEKYTQTAAAAEEELNSHTEEESDCPQEYE